MPHSNHLARQHPVAFFLILLTIGPLILGACLLFVIFYLIAVALDTLAGRP